MATCRSLVFLALFSMLTVACASQAPQPIISPQAAKRVHWLNGGR